MRSGSVFTLSVVDAMTLGLSLPARSFSRFDSAPLTSDFGNFDSSFSLRQHAQVESVVLLVGLSCADFVFSLSVLFASHLDPSLSLRSLACVDLVMSALNLGQLGSSVLTRNYARVNLSMSVAGTVRLGLSPPLLSGLHMDSTLSVRSYARLELVMLVLDRAHIDLLLLSQAFLRIESAASTTGLS